MERVFTITAISKPIKRCYLLVIILFSLSCEPERVDDPIPFIPFNDIIINLNLPAYLSLSSDGGFALIDGGVRGLIIYRKNSTSYLAFERNCSFQPNDACATIDANAFFMEDSCCGSQFNYEGKPSGGPAWRSLQQYQTSQSGSTLTISDAIVEQGG